MSATATVVPSHPLDGGRRLVLLNPRREGDEVLADAAILDGKEAPLYQAPIILTDVSQAMHSATTFVALLRDHLADRHPAIVGQSGVIVTAIVNWGMAPDETLLGTVAPPLLPKQGDYDTEPVGGVWFEVREVSAPVRGYLHATITRLEGGNPRTTAEIVFGNTDAERHAAERLGLDRYSLPALRERVVASFYGPDAELPPLSTVDTPPGQCPDKDHIIGELREQLAERDRRLAAIHDLMTCPGMTPVERIIGYGVANEAASAHSRKPEDSPKAGTVINQSAIAKNINISRQTVGARLKQWAEDGHLHMESRHTGQKTRAGVPLSETVVIMPAKTSADLITIASTWVRKEGAKHVGGNGERCPKCDGTERKRTEETVTMLTTTISCANPKCDHIHSQTTRAISPAKTYVEYFEPGDIPTMIDFPTGRTQQAAPLSTVDTPPCRETDTPGYVPSDNAPTPPPPMDISRRAWGPVACTDCYAEGRGPVGEIWTCRRCQRARQGGDMAAGGGGS